MTYFKVHGSCCSLSVSKLMGFVHPDVVEILNLDSFRSLKSCGGRYSVIHACKLSKTHGSLIWGFI
jgi:hypothetical protein